MLNLFRRKWEEIDLELIKHSYRDDGGDYCFIGKDLHILSYFLLKNPESVLPVLVIISSRWNCVSSIKRYLVNNLQIF